jgi:hypothetical protein
MNPRSTTLEESTVTITPLMNPRSTTLEESIVTITPLMNPRSTTLEESTVTITPLMRGLLMELEVYDKGIDTSIFISTLGPGWLNELGSWIT